MRLFVVLAGVSLGFAHDPVTTQLTWSAEISRIVYKRCSACHRDGGKTPMTLLDYEHVRPWAKAIRDEVLARRMPPWGAVKGYGEFRHDQSLTQDEISRIAEWVEGGAPEGDPRYLPAKPAVTKQPSAMLTGSRVRGPVRLTRPVTVIAISPIRDVESSKVFARRPDGTITPLLWAFQYQGKWRRTFVYDTPVQLPAGTSVEAVPNVTFELLIRAKSPQQAH